MTRSAWDNDRMSMLNRPAASTEIGETVATMTEYEAAQKMVSKLIAAEVPARDIAIVGIGVRTVERVTGRLGYATAARSGAINGLLIGLFLSAIFVLGNPAATMGAFVGVLLVGVAVGMLLSIVTFTIVRRRRDFASVTQLAADHYDVTVLPASLHKARTALGRHTTPRPAPVISDEPPRYGERIDPATAAAAAQAKPGAGVPDAPAAPVIPPRPEAPRYGVRVEPNAAPVLGEQPPAAPAAVETSAPATAEPTAESGTAPQESRDGAAESSDPAANAPETDSDRPAAPGQA